MERYFKSFLIVAGFLFLQVTFLPLISIEGIVPDILLIWVVYNSLKRGQIVGMAGGFVVGLLQDIAATSFLGLAALSKTIAGFLAGYFFNENKTSTLLGTYSFVLIVSISAFLHNLLYFFILFLGSDDSNFASVFSDSVMTMLYTSVLSFLPMFIFSRKLRL